MKTLRLLSWITARFIVEQHREIGFVARLALLGLIIGVSVLVIVLSAITGYAAVHFGWRLAVIRSWKKRQTKTS